jgi:hypothetical protein
MMMCDYDSIVCSWAAGISRSADRGRAIAGLARSSLGFLVSAPRYLSVFFLFAMVKAIVPRYRYDQLMRLGWKVFLPTVPGGGHRRGRSSVHEVAAACSQPVSAILERRAGRRAMCASSRRPQGA